MTLIRSKWSAVVAAVSGKSHRRAGRGSQDAACVRRGVVAGSAFVVAVVCDGCSAGGSSEVGAGLGARFVAAELARRVGAGAAVDDALAVAVKDAVVAELGRVAWQCATSVDDVRAVIADCLLFTLQAAVVVDDGGYVVFGVGDGVVRVDGDDVDVRGNDDGCPDCVAYDLLDDLRDHARLRVHARGSASTLRALTIASDGALELAGADVGGFEVDPIFLANPSLATKRLNALGPAAPEDDCTVVVLRKDGAACA